MIFLTIFRNVIAISSAVYQHDQGFFQCDKNEHLRPVFEKAFHVQLRKNQKRHKLIRWCCHLAIINLKNRLSDTMAIFGDPFCCPNNISVFHRDVKILEPNVCRRLYTGPGRALSNMQTCLCNEGIDFKAGEIHGISGSSLAPQEQQSMLVRRVYWWQVRKFCDGTDPCHQHHSCHSNASLKLR